MNKEKWPNTTNSPVNVTTQELSNRHAVRYAPSEPEKGCVNSLYWLDNAINEARKDSWDHIQREIIFSVGFLETYFDEWIQSQQLTDPEKYIVGEMLNSENKSPNFSNKWKNAILYVLKIKSPGKPVYPFHAQLEYLLDLRGGLRHIKSNRGATANIQNTSPQPQSRHELGQELLLIPNGWAVAVALDVIEQLHKHAGTRPPAYVISAKNSISSPLQQFSYG